MVSQGMAICRMVSTRSEPSQHHAEAAVDGLAHAGAAAVVEGD